MALYNSGSVSCWHAEIRKVTSSQQAEHSILRKSGMWPHISRDTRFSEPNPWQFKYNKHLVTINITNWRKLNLGRRKNGEWLTLMVLLGYCTAMLLCRQPADWTELCYWDIAQQCYCADSLQTEQSCATGILHSIGTVQTASRLNRAVLQGYCTVLVLCRQLADWTELCCRDIAQHWYCPDSLQTEQSCAAGILHSIGTVQTACRLNRAMLQGYCTAMLLCRQPADWTELCYRDTAQHWYCADCTELCYRDIAQHWYCADSLQMEQSCATGILHSNVTVQTACRLHRAVPQGYCTVLVLCRQTAQSCATGTLHSIGAVQTACRLHRAVLQGYCTVLVLCRQPADCTELCYRDIAQYWCCEDSLQTAQSCAAGILHSIGTGQTACRLHRAVLQGHCTVLLYPNKLCASTVHTYIRKCSTGCVFRLTQDIVAVCQHFAVHKQVTRADLHRWNYHNGAATCVGRAAVRAPADREHCVEENIISNSQGPWNIFS